MQLPFILWVKELLSIFIQRVAIKRSGKEFFDVQYIKDTIKRNENISKSVKCKNVQTKTILYKNNSNDKVML